MNNNRSLDWSQIKTVFLDMDGTLMDLAFDNYFWHEYVPQVYGQTNNLRQSDAKDYCISQYIQQHGKLSWYCTDYWSDQLGLNIKDLKRQIASRISLLPLTKEFLHWLKINEKRTVLLTNAHMDSVDIKMDETGIRSLFDRIISSHTYGFAKEHDEFWPLLANSEDYQLHETLLIDDNVSVLKAADRHGIKHLLSVRQPDTTLPHQDTDIYHGLNGFEEIVAELGEVKY